MAGSALGKGSIAVRQRAEKVSATHALEAVDTVDICSFCHLIPIHLSSGKVL